MNKVFLYHMVVHKASSLLVFLLASTFARSQSCVIQQGILYKMGTNLRLGSIRVFNKRTGMRNISSNTGVFSIAALSGDTIEFSSDNYAVNKIEVTDLADRVVYLDPVTSLDEVLIKENSIKSEIKETQLGYRRKSVFYTGTPHYYYLFLKPMTFIYENFKSEVIQARRFNRYANRELTADKMASRFNDSIIKNTVALADMELEKFKDIYTPTIQQLDAWNDYDLINYIKASYTDFKASEQRSHKPAGK